MRAVLTTDEIRALEQAHPRELADGTLMRRAAFAVANACARLLRDVRGGVYGARVVVLAGRGNNAGDALFAAAHLARRGCGVDVIVVWGATHDAGLAAARAAGARVVIVDPDDLRELKPIVARADLVVDGLVGIGAMGALRAPADALVATVNRSGALIVAVDIPSGIDVDSGRVSGAAVRADLTVTFAALKPGLVLSPARERAGAVEVVDIGIGDSDSTLHVLDSLDVAAFVREPGVDSHKYRRGVVGLAVGSPAYPGAALLATGAASVGVAGMVTLDADASVADLVVARWPNVVPVGAADPPARSRVTAWACGSGWPEGYGDERLRAALRSDAPVVVDAGAIGLLADATVRALLDARTAPTVITPHEGELARLVGALGLDGDVVSPKAAGRLVAALSVAAALGVIVVLKGAATVVAAPDGTAFVDTVGGSELAVAGSGDVLTGIVGAVLANAAARDDDRVPEAVAAAARLHGTAGRIAAEGGRPVSALDLIAALPAAVALARRGEGG